jgi:D-sedoheptulose 7-phosphate isomerase
MMILSIEQTTRSLSQMAENSVKSSLDAIAQLQQPQKIKFLVAAAEQLAACFTAGRKVLIAGNGGSLCDAMHFAEELTGIFRQFRRALPVIALSDPGHISCVGNDLGFEWVFARGIQAYGNPGDLFIGLTTSGKSPNIVKAFSIAKEKGLSTIAFLGKGGNVLKGTAELELIIENCNTSDHIQEAHMTALHTLIELLEQILFPHLEKI